ncbi:hypothetical protein [Actinomyces wuliandei]|uniref:hypothetical protein n=1 Tax=Actinomyces wuliandei TaxID=2057743 RepID=UPI0015D61B97|nr:hypothetical protein [Actinomyces wuliandei]
MTRTDQFTGLLERTYPPRLVLPRHRYIAQDVAERAAQASRAGLDQAVDAGMVARVRRVYQAAMPPPGHHTERARPEEVPAPRPGLARGHAL